MSFDDLPPSYQWAIDKARKEAHCVATVKERSEDLLEIKMEAPDGTPLLHATCYENHIVQFIIEAVMIAYLEIQYNS